MLFVAAVLINQRGDKSFLLDPQRNMVIAQLEWAKVECVKRVIQDKNIHVKWHKLRLLEHLSN